LSKCAGGSHIKLNREGVSKKPTWRRSMLRFTRWSSEKKDWIRFKADIQQGGKETEKVITNGGL